jgi:glycerophosphoryl diester phosphodiesterase
VGHKGADTVAPGNTLASFEAALAAGVDMIEFDVLPLADGRLVIAHDPQDANARVPLTLAEGLDHLAGDGYAGIELDIDLKAPTGEDQVATELAQRGLFKRALVSSAHRQSLDRLGEIAPQLARGWAVPRVRRDYTKSYLALVAYAVLRYWRRQLPTQAHDMLGARRCEAVMAHRLLVSRRLVESVHSAGGALYVWTVDDAAQIRKLAALGVDGVITNDPRLFQWSS